MAAVGIGFAAREERQRGRCEVAIKAVVADKVRDKGNSNDS